MTRTDWPRVSLKRLVRFGNGTDHKNVENETGPYRVFGSGGHFARATDFLHDGESVLFGRKGTIDKPLYVNEAFWTVDTVYYTVIGPRLVPRWFYYWATTIPFTKYATQTALPSMTAATLGNLQVQLPSVSEQKSVADFLDRETAQIDAMIEAQENVVNLVRERRESFITEAISDFPRVPLKRLIDPDRPLTYGILQAGVPQLDGVPYIGPADIPGEGVAPKLEDLRLTTKEIAAKYHRSVLKAGDVVVSIGPAYGRVMVTTSDLEGSNLTQDTARVALKNTIANSHFVVWALCSFIATEFWDKMINGATFRRLNLGTLGDTPIPFPPISEQRSIAKSLQIETAKADQIIDAANEVIALFRERREALITAAITGRIDPETGIEYPENPETPKES